MPLLKLTIFWIIYYISHSFLIDDGVKKFIIRNLGISEKTYRLVYVLFSTLTLAFILFYIATLKHHYFWRGMISQFFGLMLTTYSLFILKGSFRKYNAKAFLGLADPDIQSGKLIVEGLQKHIRHPLYAGTLLLFTGFFFFMPTVENSVVVIITIIYVFIGIALEEKKLIKQFGEDYLKYKKTTPMLFPKIRK